MYLFKVYTKKFSSFVVANTFDEAKDRFTTWLQEKDYGFLCDRRITKIEILASIEANPSDDNFSQLLLQC